MNRPNLCGQYKKAPYGSWYLNLSNELTSLFEWCQFCFKLDALMIVEMYVLTYEEASLLIGLKFYAVDTFGFEYWKEIFC